VTTTVSRDWLRKIDRALLNLNQKPQFGLPHPFPLEDMQQALSRLFKVSQLVLQVQEKGWVMPQELWKGLPQPLLTLTMSMLPLDQNLFFVMGEQDLKGLMAEVLGADPTAGPFYDQVFAAAFYQYLGLALIQQLEQLGFAQPFSPRLLESPKDLPRHLASTPCFVTDVSCVIGGHTFWGRCLVPEPFRDVWKQHVNTLDTFYLDARWHTIPIDISVSVGDVELPLSDWKQILPGDFLLLDRCSYEAQSQSGMSVLYLEQEPLFRAKIKDNELHLLEFPHEDLGEDMESEHEQEQVTAGVDLQSLPVTVTVEVARVKMTLKELTELSVGSVLQLPMGVHDRVTLLVNGKKAAHGELISVGETLGVRIISI